MLNNLIVKLMELVSGKTREELRLDFSFHLFTTRSPVRAYWWATFH